MADKTIHVRQFDGGRSTPDEYHRKNTFMGKSCSTCGDSVAMSATFLAPEDELSRREPELYMALAARAGGRPSFQSKYGPLVCVETVYACDLCKAGLKRYCAKKPDWVFVQFNDAGLSENYPTKVQIPGGVGEI